MMLLIKILFGAALGALASWVIQKLVKRRPRLARRCSTCAYFDLIEGQAVLKAQPTFMRAAAVLPPAKMGTVVTYDEDGTRHEQGPPVPQSSSWDQFGACFCPTQVDEIGNHVLKWGGDVCPDYKRGDIEQIPTLVQIRRGN